MWRYQSCISQTTAFVEPFFLQASSWLLVQELGKWAFQWSLSEEPWDQPWHRPWHRPWHLAIRLLPLPEKWFTVACHLCAIFAGGFAGCKKSTEIHETIQSDNWKCRIDPCRSTSNGVISMVPTEREGHCNSIWDGASKFPSIERLTSISWIHIWHMQIGS